MNTFQKNQGCQAEIVENICSICFVYDKCWQY